MAAVSFSCKLKKNVAQIIYQHLRLDILIFHSIVLGRQNLRRSPVLEITKYYILSSISSLLLTYIGGHLLFPQM